MQHLSGVAVAHLASSHSATIDVLRLHVWPRASVGTIGYGVASEWHLCGRKNVNVGVKPR